MARLWKSGENGIGKNGKFCTKLYQIVFFDLSPVSYQFHTFFALPTMYFWQFPTIPKIPPIFAHSPPFFSISPHFPPFPPFFFTYVASWLIRLWLTPTPGFAACGIPYPPFPPTS